MGDKIFLPPKGYEAPSFNDFFKKTGGFDFNKYDAACNAHMARLREWCLANGKGDIRGEIIRFPIADGAQYMVESTTPLRLLLLQYGDAWDIDEITERGLRVTDVRAMVKSEKALREIFGKSNRR